MGLQSQVKSPNYPKGSEKKDGKLAEERRKTMIERPRVVVDFLDPS